LNPEQPDVLCIKRRYGIGFGAAYNLSFSVFSGGIGSPALNAHRGMFPWLKFFGGAIICTVAGEVAGWLSAKFDSTPPALHR